MKTKNPMRYYTSIDDVKLDAAFVTIGSFDGVHLGHQSIITDLVNHAKMADAKSVVITFYPHPAVVLQKNNKPIYLTHPERRAELFENLGVDVVITFPFTLELANMRAEDFMRQLKNRLNIQQLWIGYDFSLGKNREGNAEKLEEIGKVLDYQLQIFNPIKIDDQTISSSMIRSLIVEGQVSVAAKFLGRNYQVRGEIIHGDSRGRTLGFPTANVQVWKEQLLPKPGIYATWSVLQGQRFPSVTNIGYRPTFSSGPSNITVEPYLIDFDRNIYHEVMDLEFVQFVRDELKFSSIEALKDQISTDIINTKKILSV
jgi:riboflavin kinase/FMN adenylyltransferase